MEEPSIPDKGLRDSSGRLVGLIPLVLVLGLLIGAAFLPLASAWKGYPFYRDQHLGTAIIYAQEGIDLLHPRMVGFTATDTPAPQEFPLWQAFAAVLLKAGGGWWGWGSVASLLMFATCLWPVYRIGKWVGEESGVDPELCGRWSTAWFISVPIVFYLAGEASVDGWSFAVCIWFFFFVLLLLKSSLWRWVLPACALGMLAATTKLPFFFASGVAAGFYMLFTAAKCPVKWVQLCVVGMVSTLGFLVWTRWCDSQLALAEFPYWELRLSHNPAMWKHYFGTWDFRLDLANWLKGGWRIMGTLFGSFALSGAFIFALFSVRSKILWSWIIGCGSMLLVFTHLILVHRHYYLIFAPIVAFAFGVLIVKLQTSTALTSAHRPIFCVSVALIIVFAVIQGLMVMEVPLKYDPYPARIANHVNSLLPPGAKPLVQNGGWGGDIFMRMKRPGLSVHTALALQSSEQLERLKQLGYTHLVMLAESPLLTAFQVTNPGQADLKRLGKYDETTPLIKGWKPAFEDEDIAIFEFSK